MSDNLSRAELIEQAGAMQDFLISIHTLASLSVPEVFDPEDQAMVVRNKIRREARMEVLTQLLGAAKSEQEKTDISTSFRSVEDQEKLADPATDVARSH